MSDMDELSRRERQLMDIVYKLGEATAAEVMEHMDDPPGFSSVRKWLFLMEQRGLLTTWKDGRRNVYRPATPRRKALSSAMHKLVDTFFGGSKARAVTALLKDSEGELSESERDEILDLIQKRRSEEAQP